MKLLHQFPDASMKVRLLSQKRTRKEIRNTKEYNGNGKELDLYYDNEFRKWHTKLALIIVFIIAGLSAAIIAVSKLLQ